MKKILYLLMLNLSTFFMAQSKEQVISAYHNQANKKIELLQQIKNTLPTSKNEIEYANNVIKYYLYSEDAVFFLQTAINYIDFLSPEDQTKEILDSKNNILSPTKEQILTSVEALYSEAGKKYGQDNFDLTKKTKYTSFLLENLVKNQSDKLGTSNAEFKKLNFYEYKNYYTEQLPVLAENKAIAQRIISAEKIVAKAQDRKEDVSGYESYITKMDNYAKTATKMNANPFGTPEKIVINYYVKIEKCFKEVQEVANKMNNAKNAQEFTDPYINYFKISDEVLRLAYAGKYYVEFLDPKLVTPKMAEIKAKGFEPVIQQYTQDQKRMEENAVKTFGKEFGFGKESPVVMKIIANEHSIFEEDRKNKNKDLYNELDHSDKNTQTFPLYADLKSMYKNSINNINRTKGIVSDDINKDVLTAFQRSFENIDLTAKSSSSDAIDNVMKAFK